MRLGVDEVGVTELAGVAEHARSMSTTAAALLLESLQDTNGLVVPLAPGAGDPAVERLLVEISEWAAKALGQSDVPMIWRMLARNPHHLEATWRKEMAVMAERALAAHDKRRVALGVSMAVRVRYMTAYQAAILRGAGDSDRDILEVLGVVDHYTSLNTMSEAMQIESDIRPPGGDS
jgi:alkylhydroperoxidase/carboxymuconolactone decarboxylase family protein YurZ